MLSVVENENVMADSCGDPSINAQKTKALVETIAGMNHGTIINWPVIREICDMTENEQCYPFLQKARRLLVLNHGIFLETIPKVGYRIIPKGLEIYSVQGKYNRGTKMISRAVIEGNLIRNPNNETLQAVQKMSNVALMLRNS